MIQTISHETFCDLLNIKAGLFAPLTGFMNGDEYYSVVNNMTLDNAVVFTIPVTLDLDKIVYCDSNPGDVLELKYNGEVCGTVKISNKFIVCDEDFNKVFGTDDVKHPGIALEKSRSMYRAGGKIITVNEKYFENWLLPGITKEYFKKQGWKTIAGFQTRNPIHNAHEHLQRTALELCDGLFINPIIGWKKKGDFTNDAVVSAYQKMIEEFYPKDRVYLKGLRTPMRYAGSREALFHALIRKNLGCTHFIIGRDHAGVGNYYGAYDAHELALKMLGKYDFGIELLLFREPYYCEKCGFIVSDKTCSHYNTHRKEVSGTIIRDCIQSGKLPPEILMRPEIAKEILKHEHIFIDQEWVL
jgi:sulfate adenylyltransferase